MTPLIARGMQKSFIKNPGAKAQAKALTPRQREVIQLLAEGKSMKEAAGILHITERTVAFHKYRVMGALNLGTSAELIQLACSLLSFCFHPELRGRLPPEYRFSRLRRQKAGSNSM